MPRKRKEVEEEEGVTRCVCGHEELQNYATKQRGVDPSLFIQCDQCEVWQHGYCVGLAARDVPDVYYCEECRPEFHEVKTKNGRTTSRYTPQSRQSGARRDQSSESDGEEDSHPRDRRKRRQTMNSREDDILQRVLEQSAREAELLKRKQRPKQESEDPEPVSEPEPDQEAEADQEDEGKSDGGTDGANQAEDFKQEPNERGIEAGTETDVDADAEIEAEDAEADAELPEQERETDLQAKEEEAEEEEEVKQATPPPKRKRRPRGRPGPKAGKPTANSAVNGKKCKPKIPSARATFTEMRKRVAMILEFSGHTQSEMMSEDEFRKNMLQEQQSLENNEAVVAQVETLYSQHKQNISQLEGLTAKLVAWQEKYG